MKYGQITSLKIYAPLDMLHLAIYFDVITSKYAFPGVPFETYST